MNYGGIPHTGYRYKRRTEGPVVSRKRYKNQTGFCNQRDPLRVYGSVKTKLKILYGIITNDSQHGKQNNFLYEYIYPWRNYRNILSGCIWEDNMKLSL